VEGSAEDMKIIALGIRARENVTNYRCAVTFSSEKLSAFLYSPRNSRLNTIRYFSIEELDDLATQIFEKIKLQI
jgi:hypothetical protein